MKAITHSKPRKEEKQVPQSLHKTINWVVSIILLVFAIWSIHMNSQGQSYFKQSSQLFSDIDKRLTDTQSQLQSVKDACLSHTVVIPTTPVETPKETQ